MDLLERIGIHNEKHPETRAELRYTEGGDTLIAISGELDMKAATFLTPLLEAVITECPARSRLFLDMTGVAYISSTGVGFLASLLVQGQKRSVSLFLTRVPVKVRNILDVLGLSAFFPEESPEPETRGPA
jgi:anti-anti-sigma factor